MAYGTNKKKSTPKKQTPPKKKGIMESYGNLSTTEKILKAPGYAVSAALLKTIKAGEYGAKKLKEMKSKYGSEKKTSKGKTQQSKKSK
jgi:hypothetical protein